MAAKILIVHDQPHLLKRAKKALEPEYTAITCGGVREAIALLNQFDKSSPDKVPVDLIACSVHMEATHALTVFDLLKWLRGEELKNIPVLLICFQPGKVAKHLNDAVQAAGTVMGASGHAVLEQFEAATFVKLIESYLPAQKRTT